ncbi:O-methyltransferase [Streptomyces carpaticus]|uniref:Predicted O-methyltransferase YrrM n=3 Tax=Streptomyces TaxID=1883 RepID=A0A1I6U0L8_9ACTN|nr:O-methyltransferase [Streptomyces harbinensis]UWM50963.1 O-methyltransferase [Streptomyces carpaticus]SFS95026.1 Predicted O-methyltransferase YrrM [Streptomyces harbinensis]
MTGFRPHVRRTPARDRTSGPPIRFPPGVATVKARERRGQEKAITGNRLTSWAFAEAYGSPDAESPEGAALRWARDRSVEGGVRPVSPGAGDTLRLLTAACGARAVVEIGTGTGVSGIHLLQGMRPDGVLTTVDIEPERLQFARQAFRAAGFAANRARFIPGHALDVLPRLTDGGYDLVFCDADRLEYLAYLAESLRLLRPGGLVVFAGVFAGGRTVDSGPQPTEVLKLRELLRAVRESDALMPALLPAGDGLLCAARR